MSHALGNPVTHLWLLRRMARLQGVDLTAAQAAGVLTQSDWADMVTACRACAGTSDCTRQLDRSAAGDLPAWCANKIALLRIAEAISDKSSDGTSGGTSDGERLFSWAM